MTTKKLTIEDILKKKKVLETRQNEPFYSDLFGGEIDIEDIPMDKIAQIINSASQDEPLKSDCELIYECCPIFRSKKLHEECGVTDPIDVIGAAFCKNIQEIDKLAKHIMKRYGYFAEKVEKVKKL